MDEDTGTIVAFSPAGIRPDTVGPGVRIIVCDDGGDTDESIGPEAIALSVTNLDSMGWIIVCDNGRDTEDNVGAGAPTLCVTNLNSLGWIIVCDDGKDIGCILVCDNERDDDENGGADAMEELDKTLGAGATARPVTKLEPIGWITCLCE